MPLYVYRCKNCSQVFEKMIRWSEAGRAPICPNCQSCDTHKMVSNIASVGSSLSANSGTGTNCGSGGGFR
jgi:putative FmdB family regulatory protein